MTHFSDVDCVDDRLKCNPAENDDDRLDAKPPTRRGQFDVGNVANGARLRIADEVERVDDRR